jgi:hypothetical protein
VKVNHYIKGFQLVQIFESSLFVISAKYVEVNVVGAEHPVGAKDDSEVANGWCRRCSLNETGELRLNLHDLDQREPPHHEQHHHGQVGGGGYGRHALESEPAALHVMTSSLLPWHDMSQPALTSRTAPAPPEQGPPRGPPHTSVQAPPEQQARIPHLAPQKSCQGRGSRCEESLRRALPDLYPCNIK